MPNKKGTYTMEEIGVGFERFLRENGHYPTAPEIDNCEYLPSSRQIQRNFKGLPTLRKQLGFTEINFGIGKFRSKIASARNKSGFAAERELEETLINYFGEQFVHIEKPVSHDGRQRYDFFIYAQNLKFGVDVFYSETRRNIEKNINSKIDNYHNTISPIYFVLANDDIPQQILNQIATSKLQKPLPQNIKLLTMEKFIEFIQTIIPLKLIT